jgi:CHAT domain-containing protein
VAGALWRVEDQVSSDIMTRFYEKLPNADSAAEALQRATLAWIETDPERSSPAFWSAFGVIGI